MRRITRLTCCLLLVAAGSCGGATAPDYGSKGNTGGNTGGTSGGSTSTSITVANNNFDPVTTTVSAGATVTWTWNACSSDGYGGTTCTQHNVTFDDGRASATQSDGTWSRSFGTAGSYAYHCTVHGTYMAGTIVVK